MSRLAGPQVAHHALPVVLAGCGTYGVPFWLSCHFFGAHLPYLIPDEWYDRYDPADVELPASMAETFDGSPAIQRAYSAYWGTDGFDEPTWRKLTAVHWGYVSMIDQQAGRILTTASSLERTG